MNEIKIYRYRNHAYYEHIAKAIDKVNQSENIVYKHIDADIDNSFIRPLKDFEKNFRLITIFKGFKAFKWRFLKCNKYKMLEKFRCI